MGEVWFAPDDPSLPMPWKGIVDGNTGCLYYWNPETNITQYEKPAYLVSSPSLSPSCSPGLFHPPHPTASDYNLHSQYPNLYPHYQAPAETVINGYTFPTQFPFPNHTHTPPNQPINPQSQFTDYHYRSLTHPPIAHPSYHLPPFATSAYPSEPSDQPFSCDPYSTSPHNSSYSPITYPHTEPKESIVHPYQLPYTGDLIPPSALAYTAGGTSCTEKDDVSPPEMKKSLRHNLKMRSHVMMKRKPRSQFPRRRRIQNNGDSEGDLCKASLLMAVNWDSTILSNKSLDSISEMTILDLVVKNGSISTSSKDAPMFFPGDDVDAVYDQLLGSDGLYQTERAKDILLLEGFRQILDKKGGPVVDRELSSIDMELARSYLNLHLEMPLMDSGNIPETNVQGAILNHFYQVTNLISGLKPNLLSTSFVESPVILEVSIPESYELGSKHEAVEFVKLMGRSFTVIKLIKTPSVAHLAYLRATLPNWQVRVNTVLSSNKGGFDYDMNLESLRSNSQQLFVNKHGKRIESKCSALYHWLPSSLNWNKKCISVAFLSLELFVSSVTSKSLLFESCRGGAMSMGNAMEETLLENIALQIVIATNFANLKQLSYPLHLAEELATETVSHTLSTAIDLQLFKAIIVHALQLGLSFWVVVLHFIAVLKKLLVIGINSNGLITVSVEDFSNKMFLICCLLTTAESRTFFGRFRSLKKNKPDGRLNLHVQCISRMQLWHMGISCIIDTNGKQLENSPFCEQLKKQYGVFCFVILVEGYMMTFLLYFEDHIFQIWLNMRSKIGACTIIELSQRMNKMQIFPLDNTSWKLVVLKHVKSGLQINIFSYYVQRVVTLGIIHFGCGFFPFLYECVDYSSTIVENPTVIIRGAKDGNLLHWKMATGTLGHLNLHAHLGFDYTGAAHNALECLTGLLRHDTEVYFRYFLGIAEIYVAWKKTKFLPVFYINLSNPILDEDLEYIMKTLVSTNSTTLQSTTWNVISIFHGSHCQVFSMSLFEMTPKPFYTATVTTKVRPDEPTLLKVSSATFGVAKIALEHHYPSLEQTDALLNSNSMVIPLRCCSAYFIVRRRVTFGGIHTANSLGILQTGQEEYNVQSYMKKVNAHKLLILNPSDVVVKMGLRTLLSTYFKLIFALILAKKIVDAADMIEEVRGTITVHDAIPFIMLTTGSCGYWNAKKAKAKSLHAIMWGAWFSLQRILLMKALQMLLFTQRLLGYNWRTFGSISNLLNSKA